MLRYVIIRLLERIPLLAAVGAMTFLGLSLLPGDTFSELEMNWRSSADQIERLRSLYGLDQPFYIQFWRWLRNFLVGDWGYSFVFQRPVLDLILERFVSTVWLSFSAFLLTLGLSLPLGLSAALRPDGWNDRMARWLALAAVSFPPVLSSVSLLLFAFWTGWFPVGGSDTLAHLFLPALSLALPSVALFTMTVRAETLNALEENYIIFARARGLGHKRILCHAFRGAANPVISLSGVTLGSYLGGAVVVEKVFGWPGMGALMVDSILARDLFVVVGCVLVAATFVMLANLLADLLLALNDPRLRQL